MLPESLINIPKLGSINLHASYLPNYRGAAPINWVIINGEKETGITVFFLNKNIDEGDLSKLRSAVVCGKALAGVATKLSLGNYLILGTGERKSGGYLRESILGDAVEALIGAIYLDTGFKSAEQFVLNFSIMISSWFPHKYLCKTSTSDTLNTKWGASP